MLVVPARSAWNVNTSAPPAPGSGVLVVVFAKVWLCKARAPVSNVGCQWDPVDAFASSAIGNCSPCPTTICCPEGDGMGVAVGVTDGWTLVVVVPVAFMLALDGALALGVDVFSSPSPTTAAITITIIIISAIMAATQLRASM